MMNKKIVLAGSGLNSEVILRGITGKIPPSDIIVTDDDDRVEHLVARYSVSCVANRQEAVKNGDIVIVSLTVEATAQFLQEISAQLSVAKLLIYISPVMSSTLVRDLLGHDARIIRAFLNVSAQVLESPIVICKAGHADEDDVQSAKWILGCLGRVFVVPEPLMDPVLVLAGTSPAYVLTLAETLENEAVRLGFGRTEARSLISQIVYGIATLLRLSERDPRELRDMMTPPGGLTAEGIRALENAGFRSALSHAIDAASRKSRELTLGEMTGAVIEKQVEELSKTVRVADNLVSESSAAEAFSLISSMNEVKLSRFSVVGNYLRFDEVKRNLEKDVYRKIIKGFSKKIRMRENHIIWGPSGSGKTYFVREIARSLGDAVVYKELNLADRSKEDFLSELGDVDGSTDCCLCAIDETDAKSEEKWPYDEIFTHLDANRTKPGRKVFILLGSSGSSLTELEHHIKERHKGNDLLKRIPARNCYEIPIPSMGDRIIVVLSRFSIVGRQHGMEIRSIEKFALYYVVVNNKFTDNKQLDELALATVERMAPLDDVVKYDHLFEYGEPENKYFWWKHSQEALKLAGKVIAIED